MKIGIEIETILRRGSIESVQHALTSANLAGFVAKYDGSLGASGVEVVTPPMSLDDMPALVTRAVSVLDTFGAHASDACGLHVHVTAPETLHGIRNIVRRAVNFSDTIDALTMPSRRHDRNAYCRDNGAHFGTDAISAVHSTMWDTACELATLRELVRLFNPRGRYYKVNLEALGRHGTIEFRQMHGTVDAREIIGWARFVHEFCGVAVNQTRLWRRPNHRAETRAERVRKILRGMSGASRSWVQWQLARMGRE